MRVDSTQVIGLFVWFIIALAPQVAQVKVLCISASSGEA